MKKNVLREYLKNREKKPEVFVGYTQILEEKPKKKAKKGDK